MHHCSWTLERDFLSQGVVRFMEGLGGAHHQKSKHLLNIATWKTLITTDLSWASRPLYASRDNVILEFRNVGASCVGGGGGPDPTCMGC